MRRINYKGAIHMGLLAAVVLGAAILFIVIRFYGPTVLKLGRLGLDLGKVDCPEEYIGTRIEVFRENIIKFATEKRQDGSPNPEYDPDAAIRHFKIYLGCRDNGQFSPQDVVRLQPEINISTKAAYLGRAKQICTKFCASSDNDVRDDAEELYSVLVDDYYDVYYENFEKVDFPMRSSCNSECGRLG